MGNSWQYRYDTGWISNSDWTDNNLGTVVGGYVYHNLNAPLSNLLVKIFLSSDGTDANSSCTMDIDSSVAGQYGLYIYQVDNNTISVQTGASGIMRIDSTGAIVVLGAATAYYYKVKVWFLG